MTDKPYDEYVDKVLSGIRFHAELRRSFDDHYLEPGRRRLA